jgi:hypothetical protein
MSAAVYVMCKILCDFLWWMYYSLPQNMVNSVKSWPEYQELFKILQHMVADVERIIEHVWEIFWRGNEFNYWKHNRNYLFYVLTVVNFQDAEQ